MIKAVTQALVLCAIFVVSATAQTWDGGGAAGGAVTWTTAANWNPDGVPANNGTANIIMAGTIDTTNTVDVNFDINSLTFNNTAGAFIIGNSGGATLTIRGGGIVNNDLQSQTINAPIILGASQTWTPAIGGLIIGGTVSLGANQLTLNTPATTPTISGVIEGAGSFLKTGPNSVQIIGSSANTYTGLTTVNDGSVSIQKTVGNAIPGNLTIGDGIGAAGSALVSLQGLNQIADNSTVTILSDGRLNVNGLSDTTGLLRMFGGSVTTGGGTLTLSDNIQVDASATTTSTISGKLNLGGATRDIQVGNGAAPTDLDISAAISNGGVTKSGPGQLQYSGSVLNTYLGMTTVNEGNLFLNKDDNILSLPGDLTINNGAIVQNGHIGQTSGNTDVAINNFGNLQLSFNATIASLSLNDGVVQHSGTAALTVLGPITVSNATTTSVVNIGNGTLELAGSGSNITTASLDPGLEDLQFSGKVTSTNGLTKNGAGWLSLLGAVDNSISGTTTINQGKLVLFKNSGVTALAGNIVVGDGLGGFDADVLDLFADNQIAQTVSDTITINSSGRFDLHNSTEGIGNLVLNAGRVTGGTISFTGSVTTSAQSTSASITSNIDLLASVTTFTVNDGVVANDLNASGAITNGSFVKAGAGTMLLSGTSANTATLLQLASGTVILDKSAGVNALGGTEVIVSDGAGLTQSDILRYGANDHQLPDTMTVTVQTAGLFDTNGRSDTIGSLNLVGGAVQTGVGTLTVANQVTSVVSSLAPTISGNLNLAGGLRPFDVGNDVGPVDLSIAAAMSNGTLVKQNTGTLGLSGSALTSNISYQLEAGEISANGLTIGVGRSFTMNAGTFSGALNNSGAFVYNAGTFSGQLANKLTGATTFNADFTAAGGLANEGTITVAAGRTLTAGGTGVSNDGTFVLDGGTLTAAASNFVNQQVITGHGQLNASGPALNNSGDIVVTGGHLLVNATLGIVNSGVISVGSGLDLQVSGGGVVQNNGLIALNGGRILGSLSITNGIGGEIRGGSSVEMPVNNVGGVIRAAGTGTLTITSLTGNSAGGELRVDDGATLLVQTPFSSSGTIVLAGANATLNGGNVTNTGTLRGAGRVNSVVTNNGTIRAENGTLTFPATGHSNPAAGRIEAGAGAQVLFSQGLATNSGMIALTGGAFDNNNIALSNPGRIEGHGTLRTGGLTNSSTISVGGTLEVLGPVTQNAVVDTQAGSTTRFFSPVSGPGSYTGTGSVQFLNTFSPGASPAAVSFGGNVTFTGSATLVIEIAGTTAGSQYDTLTVAGNASLAGALDIDLLGGFIPTPGNSFQIISADGGVNGAFSNVLLPVLAGANWQLIYNATSVLLQVALAGDYNFNGTVDTADYVVWRKTLNQIGTGLPADGNGNGQIDPGDLTVWRSHFGQPAGSGASASANATVPEPATLALLMLVTASWCIRRGRAA